MLRIARQLLASTVSKHNKDDNNMTPLQTETAMKIIRKIEYWVKKNSTISVMYKNWYVGVTNAPHIRKRQHKTKIETEPYFWQEYNARTKEIALAIETRFHKKGMKESHKTGGVRTETKYVYVYKKYPTIFD